MTRWLSLLTLLCVANALPAANVQDPMFAVELIHSGNGLVPIVFGAGGRMYVGEKSGRILVFKPDPSNPGNFLAPVVFASLEAVVNDSGERGLLGLAVHPNFTSNRWLYAFYSYSGGQRLVRVTADASFDQISGAPLTLLDGLPNNASNHNAGDICFHPDGSLFMVIGDDANTSSVQNLNLYHGKILRVDDDGFGINDNPFFDGDPDSTTSRIWGLGCRNPFRFTFHPATDVLYVSENGNSIDRVTRWGAPGANGGWPNEFTNPSDPDVTNLLTPNPSITGIAIVRGGPFADPAVPGSDALYVASWSSARISRWRLTGSNLDGVVPINIGGNNRFITNLNQPADITVGPDGALYISTTGTGSSAGELYRVRFVAGGSPPQAGFATVPAPPIGTVPLTVDFLDASTDDDGNVVSWLWEFGDGSTSTEPSPTHTYNTAGSFTATLTVTDDLSLQDTTSVQVTVNQGFTLNLTGSLIDGRDLAGSGLPVATELRLYQIDGVTPLAYPGGSGTDENIIAVDAGGAFNLSGIVELIGGGFVMTAGEPAADGFQAARRGFKIPAGSVSFTSDADIFLSDSALRGHIMDTLGEPAVVDLGVSRGTPDNLFAIPGGRDLLPPIPASGVAHRVESDALGYYYIPLPSGTADEVFHVSVVADTNTQIYLPTTFSETIAAGALVERDITLGLQQGGADCDALPPPGGLVDYEQVQEIFDAACIGCHSGLLPNGDLDLSAGVSLAAILSVPSLEVPGLNMVEPGDGRQSFLMEKINCALPQVGTRMPPSFSLSAADQGLVLDWIEQGGLETIEPDGTLLFEARFDADEGGFTYLDDTFRGTSEPSYADGGFSVDGHTSGALLILLGGEDDLSIAGMSGGWRRTIDLQEETGVALFFRYLLAQTPDYEDAVSEVLVSVDGVPLELNGSDHVDRIQGDGVGGDFKSTNWRGAAFDLGVLAAGEHTLTIGGYNSEKKSASESTEVLIDDVLLFDSEGLDLPTLPAAKPAGIFQDPTTLPATLSVEDGAVDVPVLHFSLDAGSRESLVLDGIELRASGSGDDASDITSVHLYADVNRDAQVDAGDVLVASGSFSGNDGVTTLTPASGREIPSRTAETYLVAYDFNPIVAGARGANRPWSVRLAGELPTIGLLALGFLFIRSRRRRVRRQANEAGVWRYASVFCSVCLILLLLYPLGCGGGSSGGGKGKATTGTYSVTATSILATGAPSGDALAVSGLPVSGAVVTVDR